MQLRDDFVAQRQPLWRQLDAMLVVDRALHRRSPAELGRFVALYRSACADLMRSRSAGYGGDLNTYLDGLCARAHDRLYGTRPFSAGALWRMIAIDFPQTLRRHWGWLLFASVLFYGPLLVALAATLSSENFATTVMSPDQLAEAAEMYSEGFHDGRDGGTNATMAGFYVRNNIGIAFRCFATGVLFGFGSAFFLVYNGLMIGTTLGWVVRAGHGTNIGTFICGHGPFELTAITIAGAAGLMMGYALVETHGRTRIGSLRAAGPELVQLIGGATVMLLIAALLEGFWSPSGIPMPIKWTVGASASIFLILYMALAGRRSRVTVASVRMRPALR